MLNNLLHIPVTSIKRAIQKTAEQIGDLIGNRIGDRITKISKNPPQNSLEMSMIKKYLKK